MSHVETQEKQQLATVAIASFRNSLKRWESLSLAPVAEKLDDIIMSDEPIPDNFSDIDSFGVWKYVYHGLELFGFDFLDKLFSFLKEKQLELSKVESRLDFLKLKQSVTGTLSEEEQAEIIRLEDEVAQSWHSPDAWFIDTNTGDAAPDTEENGEANTAASEEESTNDSDNQSSATHENDSENTVGTAAVSAWAIAATATAAGAGIDKTTGKIEKVSARMRPQDLKKHLSAYIRTLEWRLKDEMLTSRQKKAIQKTIDNIHIAITDANHIDELATWKKLASKNILPVTTFWWLDLSPKNIQALASLQDNTEILNKLTTSQDPVHIKQLLSSVGIEANDSLVDVFRTSTTLDDTTWVVRVLSHTKQISRMAKFARAVPFLDAAAAGLDIWVYLEHNKEADLIRRTNDLRADNKNSQASFWLAMWMIDAAVWVWSVVAIASWLASAWPVGWVALWVAAVWYGVHEVVNTTYYEVRNQYLQNTHDYLNQYSTEIKQAIIQATVRGDNTISLSMTETLGELIEWFRNSWAVWLLAWPLGLPLLITGMPEDYQSEDIDNFVPQTLEDAYRALFLVDELQWQTWGYIEYLTLQSDTDRQNKNQDYYNTLKNAYSPKEKRVEHRLQYIDPYLPHKEKEDYQSFHDAIVSSEWVEFLEAKLQASKTYADMKETSNPVLQWADHIGQYKEKYRWWLESRDPSLFAHLTKQSTKSPLKRCEFALNTQDWITTAGSDWSVDTETMMTNAHFVKDYWHYYLIDQPDAASTKTPSIKDYVSMDAMLLSLHTTEIDIPVRWFSEDLAAFRYYDHFDQPRQSISNYASSSVGTNIIYEIAHSIHGYTGTNDMISLMQFFSMSKDDALGLYYDGGRYINEDRALDDKINITTWDDWSAEKIIKHITEDDMIDTATERADDRLNNEYHQQLSAVVLKEKSYQTAEKKKEVTASIIEYASHIWDYVLLPEYLVIDAIKSGIGYLSESYIRYDDQQQKLTVLSRTSDTTIDLPDTTVEQKTVARLRNTLTKEETDIVSSIDQQLSHLIEIRGIEWAWLDPHHDELNIPIELERELTKLIYQWEEKKQELLTLHPSKSLASLAVSQQQFWTKAAQIYNGILYNISQSKLSNDQNTQDIFKAMQWNNAVPQKWAENIDGVFAREWDSLTLQTKNFSFDTDLVDTFSQLVHDYKIWGKSINQLAWDSETHALWSHYVRLLLQALLEMKHLYFDDQQQIKNITTRWSSSGQFSVESVTKRLDHLREIRPFVSPVTTTPDDVVLPESTVETADPFAAKIQQAIDDVSEDIYSKKNTVDRWSERKKIRYEDGRIISWWFEFPLALSWDDVNVPHFSLTPPLHETIRFANFVNKLRYEYSVDDFDGFEYATLGALQIDLHSSNWDVNILSAWSLMRYFPTLAKNKQAFLVWLEKNYKPWSTKIVA